MDTLTHAVSGALVGAAMATVTPEHGQALTWLGLLAGLLPDLDFLAELKGKEAAWKLHRILLHGIAPAFALGGVLVIGAGLLLPLPPGILAATVFASLTLHLFLDVLTSFGTCLFYPFSRRRFSLKSHFIVDPVVLGVCVYALWTHQAALGLVELGAYFLLSWACKAAAFRLVSKNMQSGMPANLKYATITLEPAFLAPLRWLVILENEEHYVFASMNFFRMGRWQQVARGDVSLRPLALRSELLRAVLATFEFPVFRRVEHAGKTLFVLEDVKWWTERPFRPLAFTANFAEDAQAGATLQNIRQGSFFVREGTANAYLPVPVPLNTPHASQ